MIGLIKLSTEERNEIETAKAELDNIPTPALVNIDQ